MIICSCQSQESRNDSSFGGQKEALILEDIAVPRTSTPPKPPEFSLEQGSKIVKKGNIAFEVNKLELAKATVDSILTSLNGYYENEKYKAYGNRITYSLNLRVPNSAFESLLHQLEHGIGDLKSKSISAQDVTEEYVDTKIRLDNNLSYLKQYQTILKKAKSIKEVLEVQEKIRRIEEEIDSKKGKLRFLDNKVNYSTLHLELSELISSEFVKGPSFGRRIANAFKSGAHGFLEFLVAMVNIWPFLFLILFFFLGRKPILNSLGWRNKNK